MPAKPHGDADAMGLGVIARPASLRTEVYDLLRDAIVGGRFAPGTELRGADLARQLGVSRTPVREALQRLIHEGLATADASGTVCVRPLDLRDVAEFYEIRADLEGYAAARAATRIDSQDLARLREIHQRLVEAEGHDGFIADGVDLNHQLHELIRRAAGNALLARTLAQLESSLPKGALLHLYELASYRRSLEDHAGIVEALERGDAADARARAEQHVRWAAQLVIDKLTTDPEIASRLGITRKDHHDAR